MNGLILNECITDGWTDGPTHPRIEMQGRILKSKPVMKTAITITTATTKTTLLQNNIFIPTSTPQNLEGRIVHDPRRVSQYP